MATTPSQRIFFVLDTAPADVGALAGVRDLVAMPCRADGRPHPLSVLAHINDSDCQEELARFQLGALRWSAPHDLATMIYVQPSARRRGIATALWKTVTTIHTQSTGRPLTATTRRTVLGELWLSTIQSDPPPLSELVVPLTPQAHTTGVEQRHLAPDDIPAAIAHIQDRYGIAATTIEPFCAPSAEEACHRLDRLNR